MPRSTRLVKSLSRLLFPVLLLVIGAIIGGSVWLVYTAARPVNAHYLVTPDKYGQLSTRAAQVTEETWQNRDGSTSRGWLLRGAENAPAVILLHKYGADRSYVLNLGVKMNESTNYTILMPDERGHGQDPTVQNASFGGCEAEDTQSAVDFLRGLRTPNEVALVGKNLGIYGVEMGAIVALNTAVKEPAFKAIALDSVPADSDSIMSESISKRFPFGSSVTTKLAELGTRFYYFDGCYKREMACDTAKQLDNRNILLLAGIDAHQFQDSTAKLTRCFPALDQIETKTDLSPSGFSIMKASIEQSEAYDQRLIDFFRNALSE